MIGKPGGSRDTDVHDARAAKSATPHPAQFAIRAGSICSRGNVRPRNEDRVFIDRELNIFLVADGMGGHYGGQRASLFVAELLPDQIAALVERDELDLAGATKIVRRAVANVQDSMQGFAAKYPLYHEMGSTYAFAVRRPQNMLVSHVGDSRVYLFREGVLRQLTSDHTYVQVLVDAGTITKEQARVHKMRNVLINSLGAHELDQEPDVTSVRLMGRDKFLLCTDGLTDALPDRVLVRIVGQSAHPQQLSDQLLEQALQAGAKDNVAAILVDVQRLADKGHA